MTNLTFDSNSNNYMGSGMSMQSYIVSNSGGAIGFGDFGGDPFGDLGLVG